jgi:adenine-specific DNA-methyltransferase
VWLGKVTRDDVHFETVASWMDSWTEDEVDPFLVPGASSKERRRLFALGGLVRALMISRGSLAFEILDEAMLTWVSSGPEPTKKIIASAELLMKSRPDQLAALYSWAVSPTNRRRLGTYFTPVSIVRWMIDRMVSLGISPDSIVDVGAGVGAFTVEAASAWPNSRVVSVDVNPVTLALLVLRSVDNDLVPRSRNAKVIPVCADYIDWLESKWDDLDGPRLILGNPPYTRLQLLPKNDRERLGKAAGDLCGSRASLSALITAASIRALQDQDSLFLLLPAQWLEADYAHGLRQWLWDAVDRRVELHLFESGIFKDAQVDAVALFVGPVNGLAGSKIEPRPDGEAFVLTTPSLVASQPDIEIAIARTSENPTRWRGLFRGGVPSPASSSGHRPLAEFARVKRGIATGANAFFIISETTRMLNGLDGDSVRPIIHRLKHFQSDDIPIDDLQALPNTIPRWLVALTESSVRDDTAVGNYVASGERAEFDKGVLCSTRRVWHDLTAELYVPDVIIGPTSKGQFRIVTNTAEANIANNLYGLSWLPATPVATRALIIKWLQSSEGQRALTDSSRTRGGGLRKIEPSALNSLGVPTFVPALSVTF